MAQRIHESIEVQAPLYDVFTYWSNLENFPHIMQNVEEVRVAGDTSHWRVKGPLGKSVEFDARITEANPERGIGWQSLEGGEVDTSGQVRFEEVATGRTRIDVTMNYADPPGGSIGETFLLMSLMVLPWAVPAWACAPLLSQHGNGQQGSTHNGYNPSDPSLANHRCLFSFTGTAINRLLSTRYFMYYLAQKLLGVFTFQAELSADQKRVNLGVLRG